MSVVNCVLRFAAFSSIFAREACKDIFRVLKWYTKTLNRVFLSPFKNETKVKLKTHRERDQTVCAVLGYLSLLISFYTFSRLSL